MRPVARPPVDFSPLRERKRGRERDVATVTGVYRFVTGPPSFPRNTRTGREKKSTRFFQEEKNEKVETIPPSPILLHVSLFLLNAAGNRKKERKRLVRKLGWRSCFITAGDNSRGKGSSVTRNHHRCSTATDRTGRGGPAGPWNARLSPPSRRTPVRSRGSCTLPPLSDPRHRSISLLLHPLESRRRSVNRSVDGRGR